MRSSSRSLALVRLRLASLLSLAACASLPRAGPLAGAPDPRPLPATELAPGCRRLVFEWQYRERIFSARGTGAARLAPPDSLRLDLFLENGASGGFVILVADSLRLAAEQGARRYVPPPPLLWGALGRVTVSGADTIVRTAGDTLRADVGRPPVWRLTFLDRDLARIDRLRDGRIVETVERTDSSRVLYRQPGASRSLVLTVQRRFAEPSCFDAAIWRP